MLRQNLTNRGGFECGLEEEEDCGNVTLVDVIEGTKWEGLRLEVGVRIGIVDANMVFFGGYWKQKVLFCFAELFEFEILPQETRNKIGFFAFGLNIDKIVSALVYI